MATALINRIPSSTRSAPLPLIVAPVIAVLLFLALPWSIEHKAHISALATVLTVAIPVSVYLGLIYALYYYLVRRFDPFHLVLLSGTTAVVAAAVLAAISGVGMAVCLVILTFAPVVTVVGYELRGYLDEANALVDQAHG